MNYYPRFYRLPRYIQKEIRSKYNEPFTLDAIEYGEDLLDTQVEEDTKAFLNL